MEDFANRELMGWPGVSLALQVTKHQFKVVARNSNTGQEAVLYKGTDFGDASASYSHPWVRNFYEISDLAGTPPQPVDYR